MGPRGAARNDESYVVQLGSGVIIIGEVMEPQKVVKRYGRPWPLALFVGMFVCSLVYYSYIAVQLLDQGPNNNGGLAFVNGLFFVLMLVPMVILYLVVLRHPTKVWRIIVLTRSELRLPHPEWRHLPLSEVAGIGLGRWQKALGSERGQWAPIVWKGDGTHIWVGGIGLQTASKTPEGTKPAEIVLDLYRYLTDAQGPEGLLATRNLQRHSNLGVSESITSIWDPSISHLPPSLVIESGPQNS